MPREPDQATKRYYDDFSATYDERRDSPYHRMIDELEVEIATPFARNARVLELGCGTGLILSRLQMVAEEAIGIDSSEAMVTRARAKGLDARIADLRALPFDDGVFDLSCSFKVLPHVPDARAAIEEAVRVTRTGGHLVLELYNAQSLRFLIKRLAGPRPISKTRNEAHVYTRWDSPGRLKSLMPPNTELVASYGLRVLTPFAGAHRVPLVGGALRVAERIASRSALRRFGGFLVVVVRKS